MERRYWEVSRAGSLNRLRVKSGAVGAPGPTEVLVRVAAVGLNFADVFACLGLYSATPKGPFTPGLELSGIIESVGDGVRDGFNPGDRVVVLTRFGALTSHLVVPAEYVRPLPAGWTFEQGAAFPAQALTAWYALEELGNLRPQQSVLLHSAAGGVGLNALRLILKKRAHPICTVGSPQKKDFLAETTGLPRQQILVRRRRGFEKQLDDGLRSLNRDGFDLILDSIAGPFFKPGYQRLARAGRLICFGAADLMPPGSRPNYPRLLFRYWLRPRLDPLQMIAENRSLMAFNLIWLWDQTELLQSLYVGVSQALPDPPLVGRQFDFESAPAALRFLQSGTNIGKVVVRIGESAGQ